MNFVIITEKILLIIGHWFLIAIIYYVFKNIILSVRQHPERPASWPEKILGYSLCTLAIIIIDFGLITFNSHYEDVNYNLVIPYSAVALLAMLVGLSRAYAADSRLSKAQRGERNYALQKIRQRPLR